MAVRQRLGADEQVVAGGAHARDADATPGMRARAAERQGVHHPFEAAQGLVRVAGPDGLVRRAVPRDLGQHAAQPDPLHDRGLALHLEVPAEVGEGGRAVADHLEAGERRRRVVVLGRHVRPVRQPLLVLALLGPRVGNGAAAEVLRDVRVGVDEPGRDGAAARHRSSGGRRTEPRGPPTGRPRRSAPSSIAIAPSR